MSALLFLSLLLGACFLIRNADSLTLSSPMIHRFSAAASGDSPARKGSPEYYKLLVRSDVGRQKRRYRTLFPSEGSETFNFGNDLGWLHYTWVDIGTPNVSFLVALDAGSDLFWVPCDCIQCAPLSGYHGSLDKDLGMYRPAESRTSRHLPCNHELCSSGSSCNNPKQACPYTVNYYSENTSSSGLLVEDTLYLASSEERTSVHAPVIIGCGKRQSGGYLDGIAPDGLLGLGFGNISVPSILARSGLVQNSFSMCFRDDDSGRILFGDQGLPTQQSTPFLPWEGKYLTYIIEVEGFCIKNLCPGKINFQALVDSGSSFTFLPDDVYKRVALEFDRQVNASRIFSDESDWEYCYKASPLKMPEVPPLTLKLVVNKSFVVTNPIILLSSKEEGSVVFCLALQSSPESLGTIGQNLMTGYRMVFDRENLKLGWSHSNCRDLDNSSTITLSPPPHDRTENPLPTDEQPRSPNSSAVSPAVAGRAPTSIPSASSPQVVAQLVLLLLLAPLAVIISGE
ncbi:aspartic proteinase-like protein 1 [Iris pallida]|uniref:Aspartic proteinase-like protein 1 n=1 Tax=Iris pallida TaxID=29817 RepID=A0AAX6DIV4_IRIPA|nr:aspartic proteinase-like protein 1 [Iris pallida]